MVNFYLRMIKTGKMTIEEVKERWREKVETELNRN